MIALAMSKYLEAKFAILAFSRPGASKQTQGKTSISNVVFGLRYVFGAGCKIILKRPKVLFLDLPKDPLSFARTSLLLWLCLSMRIRVIGDLAGEDFDFLRQTSMIRGYALFLLRKLQVIRVLSISIARKLERLRLPKLAIVSNGIADPGLYAKPKELVSGPVNLVYVGKISSSKGIWTILDFANMYREGARPYHFHIVGEWKDDKTHKEVLDFIASCNLDRFVTIHGLLVGAEKWAIFQLAHVLVHPTYRDGQPVTILEALACGIPVIATKIGAIPDTVNDGINGYLMKDNSAAEINVGLKQIAKDGLTYQSYSLEARRSYCAGYGIELFLTKMEELLLGEMSDASISSVSKNR